MLYPKNKDAKYMLILNDINDETLESADLLNSFEGKKLRDIFNFISIDIGKMYITSLYKMQKDLMSLDSNSKDELIDILMSEIILVNPQAIISIGEEVFNILVSDNLNLDYNKKNIDIYKVVGNVYNYYNKLLIPIYDIPYISNAKKEEKAKIIQGLRILKKGENE